MATINLTILKGKQAKDGSHKLRIAVGHKQEVAYIVTNIVIENINQFKNGQIIRRPDAAICNAKIRALLNDYQSILDSLDNIHLLDCKQLRDKLLRKEERAKSLVTVQSVCEEYVNELREDKRIRYAEMLDLSCRTITEVIGDDYPIEDLSVSNIKTFDRFLNKKKLSQSTIKIYMTHVRVLVNRAIKKRLVKYEVHPFDEYKISSSEPREVDISVDSIRRIMNYDTKEKKLKVARDLFMLSFYLGGINLVDLIEVDFRKTDVVSYVRKKSRNTKKGDKKTIIPICEDAKPIIKEWMNRNTGKLDFGYKFTYSNFSRYVCRNIALVAKEVNITEKVIYYSARKSFAQFASELGIPDGVIDYCLAHSDNNKGVLRYYTKVKQKQAEIAIERVVDYVKNPDSYKQYIEMRNDIMMRM